MDFLPFFIKIESFLLFILIKETKGMEPTQKAESSLPILALLDEFFGLLMRLEFLIY